MSIESNGCYREVEIADVFTIIKSSKNNNNIVSIQYKNEVPYIIGCKTSEQLDFIFDCICGLLDRMYKQMQPLEIENVPEHALRKISDNLSGNTTIRAKHVSTLTLPTAINGDTAFDVMVDQATLNDNYIGSTLYWTKSESWVTSLYQINDQLFIVPEELK